jgi:hypothetical protein
MATACTSGSDLRSTNVYYRDSSNPQVKPKGKL